MTFKQGGAGVLATLRRCAPALAGVSLLLIAATAANSASAAPQNPDDPARISVSIKPMMLWLWVGGLMMAVGTLLSAFPGRRRRQPTDAVSAPVPDVREPEPELEASVRGG